MDNKLYYQLLVSQDLVDNNNQVTDEIKQDNDELNKTLNKDDFGFYKIKAILIKVPVQNKNPSPENMD